MNMCRWTCWECDLFISEQRSDGESWYVQMGVSWQHGRREREAAKASGAKWCEHQNCMQASCARWPAQQQQAACRRAAAGQLRRAGVPYGVLRAVTKQPPGSGRSGAAGAGVGKLWARVAAGHRQVSLNPSREP